MDKYRGVGDGASDCQGVEAPWPLSLARNGHSKIDTKNQKIPGSGSHTGKANQENIGVDGPMMGKTRGADRDLGAGRGWHRGREHMREQHQAQAHGAGRRDEQRNMEGGGCWQRPRRQNFTTG